MAEEHSLLTKEKLLDILQHIEKTKDVKIINHSVKPGTEAGDNYASEMAKCDITAQVEGKKKEYHWMVKMSPVITSFGKGMHMEEKEIMYYSSMFSKYNEMAEKKGATYRINNIPAPYTEFHQDEENKRCIIAMENLQYHGYRDAPNKKKGLSLAHAKLALEEIAKFHAFGYSYINSYPGGTEEGRKKNKIFTTCYLFDEQTEGGKNLLTNMTANTSRVVKLIEEPGQNLTDIYEKFHADNNVPEYNRRVFSPNKEGFNVICHGDLWFNNMLFK